jgi:hypothetical protein
VPGVEKIITVPWSFYKNTALGAPDGREISLGEISLGEISLVEFFIPPGA